ncbi:uncharacterized protein [Rutidosis leptorrhynchoides]|uniref:uncharacterized protein n=1 Tax=Rutidosis leptorrhynchoides TaxID=125765 RepID=UPI003A998012
MAALKIMRDIKLLKKEEEGSAGDKPLDPIDPIFVMKNTIDNICDDNGVSYEGDQVATQFVNHFKSFLGDHDDNRASGPDGYTSLFFKKAWDIIGKDVCDAIKEFFSNGRLLGEINATIISLIPKIDTPQKVSNSNLLLAVMSSIGVFASFGLYSKMIHWIMASITNLSFSICINGEIKGFFKCGRGLRQGDPISPYLFTLVMEGFFLILAKNIASDLDLSIISDAEK